MLQPVRLSNTTAEKREEETGRGDGDAFMMLLIMMCKVVTGVKTVGNGNLLRPRLSVPEPKPAGGSSRPSGAEQRP